MANFSELKRFWPFSFLSLFFFGDGQVDGHFMKIFFPICPAKEFVQFFHTFGIYF
jgi:hypothetical protein